MVLDEGFKRNLRQTLSIEKNLRQNGSASLKKGCLTSSIFHSLSKMFQ